VLESFCNGKTARRKDFVAIQSKKVLWEVDAQRDFMLPGGALYVPGAERLLPNIQKLVQLARKGDAFLISSACQHTPNDPEFKVFPPHCVRGTPGAELVPEARAKKICTVPSDEAFVLPNNLRTYEQVLLEKQKLDVFTNPHTARIVEQFASDTEFIVFGVVTEYCVHLAAKGLLDRSRRVALVVDAIETLKKEEGDKTVSELAARGARLVSTEEVIRQI
jgi:nicotinamidase/pyrazinamidase